MTDRRCQHHILHDMDVARCVRHSRVDQGGEVWTWGLETLPAWECLCDVTDRFVVANEPASARWRQSAEVVRGLPQATMDEALLVAERYSDLPGHPLIAISAGRHGTVFRRCTEQIVLPAGRNGPPACGLCVYPWLIAGHRLDDLDPL